MDCVESALWIDAYIDGELEPGLAEQMESHVRGCAACATRIEERRRLVATLSTGTGYRPVPREVRALVVESLGLARPTRPRAPAWAWLSLAACVLLTGVAAWLTVRHPPAMPWESTLVRDAVSSHIRSLMALHLADIAVSDQHTVKPWFAGKLDFSPPVADHAGEGFPLAGGRLDYVAGRPVAAIVYTRRAHVINLFVTPNPGGTPDAPRPSEDRGFHALVWSDASMRFCAVSDASADELAEFARIVREQR
jgi:anti-sigma factor RsiW